MATFLPSIFVPLVGLVFPAVTMAALFLYIEYLYLQEKRRVISYVLTVYI